MKIITLKEFVMLCGLIMLSMMINSARASESTILNTIINLGGLNPNSNSLFDSGELEQALKGTKVSFKFPLPVLVKKSEACNRCHIRKESTVESTHNRAM